MGKLIYCSLHYCNFLYWSVARACACETKLFHIKNEPREWNMGDTSNTCIVLTKGCILILLSMFIEVLVALPFGHGFFFVCGWFQLPLRVFLIYYRIFCLRGHKCSIFGLKSNCYEFDVYQFQLQALYLWFFFYCFYFYWLLT